MENREFETAAIRGQLPKTQFKEHSAPMYLTSGFVFDDVEEMRASFAGEIHRDLYSRYSNPNTSEFITKVCEMEGAEDGFAFSSGMAAIYTSLKALLKSGDHLLASCSLFGASHTLLVEYFPKWGIQCDFFDPGSLEEIRSLTRPNTKVVFAESPTNPGLDILDLELLSVLSKEAGALLVIDNCFASPYLQKPIRFGADLVIHSATKLMDGQGRVLGGITVGSEDLIADIRQLARMTGPALSPFNAWILSKSLETLSLRVDKQSDNALQIAEFLSNHDLVEQVRYPFLKSHPQYDLAKKQMKKGGVVITFRVKGGYPACRQFFDAIKMISISANLGDTRTIITHPATSTHAKISEQNRLDMGISQGTIRLSVGLENTEDLLWDIDQALSEIVV